MLFGVTSATLKKKFKKKCSQLKTAPKREQHKTDQDECSLVYVYMCVYAYLCRDGGDLGGRGAVDVRRRGRGVWRGVWL